MIETVPGFSFFTLKTNKQHDRFAQRVHSHKELSIGLILNGSTTVRAERLDFVLKENDFIIIPGEFPHFCKPEDPERFLFEMMYLDRDWCIQNIGIDPKVLNPLAIPCPTKWVSCVSQIRQRQISSSEAEIQIKNFLMDIIKKYDLQKKIPDNEPDSLDLIYNNNAEHPEQIISLDTMAQQAQLSKYTFIRNYARRFGLTPHADLTNRRIQRSILLLETELSLTEIAFECGFSDQSHFIRQFKFYTGELPTEYRKAILSNS